jgi:hypothetical protein
VFKRSVICDDDEVSDEMRRTTLKRKRVNEKDEQKENLLILVLVLAFLTRVERFSPPKP